MRFLFFPLMLTLLLPQPIPSSDVSAAGITDSSKGFDRQYREFFGVYSNGDEQSLKSKLDEFAIPSQWFTDGFGAEKGPEVVKLYYREFEYFKMAEIMKLRGAEDNPSCHASESKLKTKRDQASQVKIKILGGSTAFHIPPAQSFQISWGGCTWMNTFIYVDGAFRFYGNGLHPFWFPVKVRRADPCGPNGGTQPNGRLIHRVEPEYPEQAKDKHVKGFVKMILTIAEDGSVKDVKIVEGNPLLVDAAIQAAKQWRYTPFMNCGKPVEMQTFEHVKFPPQS